MRIVKYRSWVVDQKRMLHSFSMESNSESVTEKRVLMQFTGFKDKSGRDIYENDLLENELGLVVVILDQENGWFAVEDANYRMVLADYIRENDFKVIGNIHEDEELLTV